MVLVVELVLVLVLVVLVLALVASCTMATWRVGWMIYNCSGAVLQFVLEPSRAVLELFWMFCVALLELLCMNWGLSGTVLNVSWLAVSWSVILGWSVSWRID